MLPQQRAALRLKSIRQHLHSSLPAQGILSAQLCSSSSQDPIEQLKEVNGPLREYRKRTSFDPYKLKRFLQGREYDLKKKVFQVLERDPLFKQTILELELNRSEQQEYTMKLLKRVVEYGFVTEEEIKQDPWKANVVIQSLYAFDVGLASKFSLSVGMFVNCIRSLGTERHLKYIEGCLSLRTIGCFALTELSHGSNAKAIQTTATYDLETQEFVIHSPSKLAYKWWIGLAGKTANWSCVIAHLILKGKNLGLHAFLVPIRSMDTHLPLPGITVGDTGEKLGQNGHENGFIGFDHVRIPRTFLLNRLGDVTPEGLYTAENVSPSKRFANLLQPLSAGRVGIVGLCNVNLHSAIVIAVRYSAARKQFGPGKDELPVWEYQLQRWRLLPFVAASYALDVFRDWLQVEWASQDEAMTGSLLAELHAISSGAKPVAGWMARDAIQTSRESCGGHGYTSYNRLGILRNDHDPNLTYEGENNVLIQQTAKYLLDNLQRKVEGKSLLSPLGSLHFFSQWEELSSPTPLNVSSPQDLLDPKKYVRLLQSRVILLLQRSAMKIQVEMGKGKDSFTAWNDSQVFFFHPTAKAYSDDEHSKL